MEIKSYLEQSVAATLLTAVVGFVGIMGTRVVSPITPHPQGALAAGLAAGVSLAAATEVALHTPVSTQVKGYFAESQLDFEILTLMTTLFLSVAILTPLITRTVFKKPVSWFDFFAYPPTAMACGTVAHLKFFQKGEEV